ncbi:MAG: DUF1634 domain-containing protein [Elusimicrobiota bacterium]
MSGDARRREEGRLASLALGLGVWASGLAMAAGVAWSAAGGQGEAWAWWGIAALVATPYLRVVFLTAAYARRKNWRMLGISLCVLGLLVSGLLIGAFRN